MKINKSILSPNKFNIDNFWDDCIQKDDKENYPLPKIPTEKNNYKKYPNYSNKTYFAIFVFYPCNFIAITYIYCF